MLRCSTNLWSVPSRVYEFTLRDFEEGRHRVRLNGFGTNAKSDRGPWGLLGGIENASCARRRARIARKARCRKLCTDSEQCVWVLSSPAQYLREASSDGDRRTQSAGPRRRLGVRPLVAADHRDRLHVDGRQSAVRLDTVRRSDRRQIPLDEGSDPGRVHHLRAVGDLAGPDMGLSRGQVRAPAGRLGRGVAGGTVLGVELGGGFTLAALRCRGARRNRRRRGVRDVRGQCTEVVSGPTRAGSWTDRHGVWRRLGTDRDPDRLDDQDQRLRSDVPVLRARSGVRRLRVELVSPAACPCAAEGDPAPAPSPRLRDESTPPRR